MFALLFCYLTAQRPRQTIAKPSIKVKPAYNTNTNQWRCASSRYISSANDEKVVRPPQKPVMRKIFIVGEMTPLFSASEKNIPIKKQPTILTTNVPNGKVVIARAWHILPVKKRRQEPIKPPIPAINIIFSIVFIILIVYLARLATISAAR